MDLAEIETPDDFEVSLPSLGTVRCGYIHLADEIALLEAFKEKAPDDLVRLLLIRVGCKTAGSDSKGRTGLTTSEVGKLSLDELERFAAAFLEQSSYLRTVPDQQKEAEPRRVQEPGESNCRYLVRALKALLQGKTPDILPRGHISVSDHIAELARATDGIRTVFERHQRKEENLRRVYGSQLDTMARIADVGRLLPSSAVLELAQSMNTGSKVMQDIERISSWQESIRTGLTSLEVATRATSLSQRMEALFRLPSAVELRNIHNLLGTIHTSDALRALELNAGLTAHMLKAIDIPWLRINDEIASLKSVVDLAAIGHALRTLPPFHTETISAMRESLGDWRRVNIPRDIFEDIVKRTKLYESLGFDTRLTLFSPSAFDATIRATGVHIAKPLERDENYGTSPADPLSDIADDTPDYMRAAYAIVFALESHLRRFIDREMSRAFGENWIKHRIPGEMRKAWQEKQDRDAANSSTSHPLICYADFTDYVTIICSRNNWEEVFQRFFQRSDSIQESFRRLFPIRLCTMHARPLTNDDLLLLHVEVNRLLKAIRKR